jgi:hypothetical protein
MSTVRLQDQALIDALRDNMDVFDKIGGHPQSFHVTLPHAGEWDALPTHIPSFGHEYREYSATLAAYNGESKAAVYKITQL